MQMKRLWIVIVVCVIPTLCWADTVKCWLASTYDKDGDGYATMNVNKSKRVSVTTPYAERMTCPDGYVIKRGDCDDNNADVHVRRPEVAGNGIDDNCDGRVDEPAFYYSSLGFDTQTNSFGMWVRVNDSDVLDVWDSSQVQATGSGWAMMPMVRLAYRLEIQKLTDTGETVTTQTTTVTQMYTFGSGGLVHIPVTGLDTASAYRVRVQFYRKPTYTWWDTSVSVGARSGWFYGMTTSKNPVVKRRVRVILRGLWERNWSEEHAMVGYLGAYQADGLRFGAVMGEYWCSEFYSYVATSQAKDMGHQASVGALETYFSGHDLWFDVTSGKMAAMKSFYPNMYPDMITTTDVLVDGRPGDYLALDTNSDGSSNHSAMFLAYDENLDKIWTIEGNTSGTNEAAWSDRQSRSGGNESAVTTRNPDHVQGWGKLGKSTLF